MDYPRRRKTPSERIANAIFILVLVAFLGSILFTVTTDPENNFVAQTIRAIL